MPQNVILIFKAEHWVFLSGALGEGEVLSIIIV